MHESPIGPGKAMLNRRIRRTQKIHVICMLIAIILGSNDTFLLPHPSPIIHILEVASLDKSKKSSDCPFPSGEDRDTSP